jgi:AraC-like DNA-binding protein
VTTPTTPAPSPRRWEGALVLGSGIVVYDGPGAVADHHRHDAIQVVVGIEGAVALHTGADRMHVGAAVVPSRVEHSLEAEGRVVLVLVEPAGPVGAAMSQFAIQHVGVDLGDRLRDLAPPRPGDAEGVVTWSRQVLHRFAGPQGGDRGTARPEVQRLVRYVDEHLDGSLRLADIAHHVGLSPRQLRRDIADQLGMPFRRYVLWRRLRRAVLAVREGDDLTTAAATAGFADSAHFSRVFRGLFGLTPSEVLPLLDVSHAELDAMG